MPYMTDVYGNPSSVHEEGRRAKQAIEKARIQVAEAIHVNPAFVYFTSGATESNNMFFKKALMRIVTTKTEHPSIIRTAEHCGMRYGICWINVDRNGKIDAQQFRNAIKITDDVFFSGANNETGTIQDLESIYMPRFAPTYHFDMTQAVGHIPVCFDKLSKFGTSNIISFSAHKFGGPKGVGVCIDAGDSSGLMYGGDQELGHRPGTENVAGIVGLGKAIELATRDMEQNTEYVRRLSKKLVTGILSDIESSWLNGPDVGPDRLPGNVNISFAGCYGTAIVLALDEAGVACSSGSACSSGNGKPSHVLMAMYNDEPRANASVRFTLNEDNTEEEVDYVLKILPEIIRRLRE